ncbi:YdcF family protein [Desulfobacter latus]|uniref:YdcF family protein n=1 Tax=Desulfobacter latus TaxID=2292 RepID=A0A850T3C8_9BACT|nr:YdcF family protein [Desulfobacter latus]NWH03712.1 YdcF family protein [Desulfobacter latus]
MITIFLCCLAGYVWTYQYLNFSEPPEKSDAVVLFVGPEQEQRLKEAHQLMHEGYADTLIIPAYQQVFVMSDGQAVKTSLPNLSRSYIKKYPAFYENTHIEVLEARNMMEKLGLRSAIMVSAPWHMRRINIISSHVFNPEQFQGRCVGSRFLRSERFLLSFSLSDLKIVVTEAVKIVYFIAYEVVV